MWVHTGKIGDYFEENLTTQIREILQDGSMRVTDRFRLLDQLPAWLMHFELSRICRILVICDAVKLYEPGRFNPAKWMNLCNPIGPKMNLKKNKTLNQKES